MEWSVQMGRAFQHTPFTDTMADTAAASAKDNKNAPAEVRTKEPAIWLIAYNLISGCLWSFVLLNVFATYFVFDRDLYVTFQYTRWWTTVVQSFAVIEIINAATGVVKSPLMTTTMQVLSRLLVVWGVWYVAPDARGNYSNAYLTLHSAWAVTEVIRYYYYANHLMSQQNPLKGFKRHTVPSYLIWLRYNAFIILYPLGISSECYMIYYALGYALTKETTAYTGYALFLAFCLLAYIPGSVILFSHMVRQRAKTLKAAKTKKA